MLAITLNNIFSLPFRCIWQTQEVTENLHRQTQEVLHISLAVNYLFAHVNSLFNPALSLHFSVISVVLKPRGTLFLMGHRTTGHGAQTTIWKTWTETVMNEHDSVLVPFYWPAFKWNWTQYFLFVFFVNEGQNMKQQENRTFFIEDIKFWYNFISIFFIFTLDCNLVELLIITHSTTPLTFSCILFNFFI